LIFVTIGTHEQPFNRLIQEVDGLVESGLIKERVFIQRGIKSMIPRNCGSAELIPYQEMVEKIKNARIVITHGGPSSILQSLTFGKTPIVVPRQSRFREHVDDHQVHFTKRLEAQKKVIAVYDIEILLEKIEHYEEICNELGIPKISPNGINQLIENLDFYCASVKLI